MGKKKILDCLAKVFYIGFCLASRAILNEMSGTDKPSQATIEASEAFIAEGERIMARIDN